MSCPVLTFGWSSVGIGGLCLEDSPPPYTDYCDMLSQEIQGRKHAFLAGNLTYYVGGRYACWRPVEDETIGLTHPFHHDLRGRGFGLARHPESGFGHDFRGWEFYSNTKIAYGTVIVGDREYACPVPTSMQWRPDKVICTYRVGDVDIREEKFIAANDVACSMITSESPVMLRFDGHSLVIPKLSIDRTSTAAIRRRATTPFISPKAARSSRTRSKTKPAPAG